MKPGIAMLIVGFVSMVGLAREPWALFSTQSGVQGLAFPILLDAESQPAAVLRIDRIHRDYQRRGFFRIGLLPMIAAEEVRIELLRPDQIADTLAQVQDRLSAEAGGGLIELRLVTIVCPGASTNCLRAGRARLRANGRWQLLDGVKFSNAGSPVHVASATLQVTGEGAGQLNFESGGSTAGVNLFAMLGSGAHEDRQPLRRKARGGDPARSTRSRAGGFVLFP
ncbi:MAG: hypothetical protein M1608_14125 [Candidatus Omnitrophica bacterium]|nr:hypothetical protein [Candidatus Omnitrophota bacterium]